MTLSGSGQADLSWLTPLCEHLQSVGWYSQVTKHCILRADGLALPAWQPSLATEPSMCVQPYHLTDNSHAAGTALALPGVQLPDQAGLLPGLGELTLGLTQDQCLAQGLP